MMNLESAIQHCEEVAENKRKQVENGDWEKGSLTERDCIECAKEHHQLAEWLKELKAYREIWSKLGMWLADTRLAIAPDETLDDVDEKLVRVSQVDMIDTVLEWMDKQEVQE